MIGPPLVKFSIRKFEVKTPPFAAGVGEAAGAALAVAAGDTAVVAGESAVVAAGDIPGAIAGDIPGATEGAPIGEPRGAMGAVVAGLRPRAGVASGAMEGGAGGDMAGDGGCARLASASEKEQRQTVSSVFIIMDGWKTGSIR